MPSTPGLVPSSSPTVEPGPVTKLNTPSGSPASRTHSVRSQPLIGVSVAGLNTTVLPPRSAPLEGPPASAIGKLNGEMITHTPYGRSTSRLVSEADSVCIGFSYPSCASTWSQ
jgi:hypothetical protein